MIKKCLTILVILAMIGMIAPISATDVGIEPGQLQKARAVDVMGVGYTWDYGSSSGTSMLNNSYSDSGEYIVIDDKFDVAGMNYITNTSNNIVYKVTYTYVNLRTFDYTANNSVPSAAISAVADFDGDLLVVDMFYSPIMNSREPEFYNATVDSNATRKVSIFAEDYMTSLSSAPPGFDFRDTYAESPVSDFRDAFDAGLDESGATAFSANWNQFNTILSYALPKV